MIYCMVYGLPSLLFAHLLSIHGWSNFTGELTRFADRKFYAVSSIDAKIGQLIHSNFCRTGGLVHISVSTIVSGICWYTSTYTSTSIWI